MFKRNYVRFMAALWATSTGLYQGATVAAEPAAADAAASGNGELQEIVVTAERRSENLQQVPITVNFFTAQQLQSVGITDTNDLPQVTPGLVVVPAAGAVTIFLRGLGLSSSGGNNESPTAFYMDEVYYSSPVGSLARLENIDNVQVLKGPQGTLYGRNATAGLINITTPDPQAEGMVKTSIGYESYQTYKGAFYATGGLTDTLKANVAASVHYQNDGFGRNVTIGEHVNFVRNGDIRAKLLWEPTSADRITLSGHFFQDRGDLGIVYNLMPGSVGLNGQTFNGNIHDILWDKPFYHKTEAYDGSLKWQHTFANDLTFKSVTAYRRANLRNSNYDLDATAFPVGDANYGIEDTSWQQEFLLQGSWERLNFTVGYFYFRDRNYYPIFITENVPALTLIDEITFSSTDSHSVFGQVDYRVTDHDTVTAGLRYTVDRVGADGTIFQNGALAADIGSQRTTYREPTWRLALKHEFTDELMVYGSYSRGYKSGLYAPGNPFVPPVKPEILNAYELGFKGDLFDRHLQLGVGAFYYSYTNMQVGQLEGPTVAFNNAARAKIYGPEVNMLASIPVPVGNLQVRTDFDLLHAKFTSYQDCTISTSNAPFPGNTQTTGDCGGNDLAYAPRSQVTVSPSYTVPVQGGTLGLTVTAYRNNGYFFTVDNLLKQGPFTTLSTDISYSFAEDRSRVRLYGSNLTNVRARAFVESGPLSSEARGYPPRVIGVEFQHTWK